MAPNPLRYEREARREGAWVLVYKIPLIILVIYTVLTLFFCWLIYCSSDENRCIENNDYIEKESTIYENSSVFTLSTYPISNESSPETS